MKVHKKILMGLLVTVIGLAYTADVTVTVTMQGISVATDSTSWAIGTVTPSQQVSSFNIGAINSGGIVIDFTLALTNPTNWVADTSSPYSVGADTFLMWGFFMHDDSTFNSSWPADDDIVKNTAITATSTVFGDTTGTRDADNGVAVMPDDTVGLYLKFQAPSASHSTAEQSITVTLGGQVSP